MGITKMLRFALAAITALGVSAGLSPAFAQEAGTVANVTGSEGSVIVVRGGETFSLSAGDTLFKDDKIVTREGGTVNISTPGCDRAIPASSTIVISAGFCEAAIASADQTVLAEAGATAGGGGTGSALPIIGGLVGTGGVLAAASGGGGGGGSGPTSP